MPPATAALVAIVAPVDARAEPGAVTDDALISTGAHPSSVPSRAYTAMRWEPVTSAGRVTATRPWASTVGSARSVGVEYSHTCTR
ncbi:hypothetical protein SRABI128_04477 [Microbacterium sp. Bi128]|nr:hypothetical protein SRABI128_04477 [Microbacterium sp. Bi128]